MSPGNISARSKMTPKWTNSNHSSKLYFSFHLWILVVTALQIKFASTMSETLTEMCFQGVGDGGGGAKPLSMLMGCVLGLIHLTPAMPVIEIYWTQTIYKFFLSCRHYHHVTVLSNLLQVSTKCATFKTFHHLLA